MRPASVRLVEKVETHRHVHMIEYNRFAYLADLKEVTESTRNINDRELLDLLTKKKYKIEMPSEAWYERLRFKRHPGWYKEYK